MDSTGLSEPRGQRLLIHTTETANELPDHPLTYFTTVSEIFAFAYDLSVYGMYENSAICPITANQHNFTSEEYTPTYTIDGQPYGFDCFAILHRQDHRGQWHSVKIYDRLEDVPQAYQRRGSRGSQGLQFNRIELSTSADPEQDKNFNGGHFWHSPGANPEEPMLPPNGPHALGTDLSIIDLFEPDCGILASLARCGFDSRTNEIPTEEQIDQCIDLVVGDKSLGLWSYGNKCKEYRCDFPNCGKLQRRPSAFKIHLRSHFRIKGK